MNARIVRAVGARRTALLGVALLGAGEVCSGFSTRNLGGLFVFYGGRYGDRLEFAIHGRLPPRP